MTKWKMEKRTNNNL